MVKKKLTPRLKEKIKKEYKELKKADFGGEALTYLKRVTALSKARAVKLKLNAYIEYKDLRIYKDSPIYKVLHSTALALNSSDYNELRSGYESYLRLEQKYGEYQKSNSDTLRKVVSEAKHKIIVNGRSRRKGDVLFDIDMAMQRGSTSFDVFVMLIDYKIAANGDVVFNFAKRESILGDSLDDFLDDLDRADIEVINYNHEA